nr:FtsX-like permease family protein [Goodfellowiella coeruleoviolacea]
MTAVRIAFAELRARPGRAVLPGVALLVGVACLVASLVLNTAMAQASQEGGERTPDPVALVVAPDRKAGGEPVELDAATRERVAAVAGVARVVSVDRVRADVLLSAGRAGTERAQVDVEPDEAGLRRYAMADGRPPSGAGEVAVDRVTAYQHGLRPGDVLPMADAAGARVDVRISGITLRGGSPERVELVATPALAARLGQPQPRALDVLLAEGAPEDAVRAAVATAAGSGLRVSTAEAVRREQGDDGGLGAALLPFSVLALATAVFVASATFRAVYLQRQQRTALLRCLGANRKPLVIGNLAEALLVGALAGLAGAALGGVAALLLARVFDVTGVSAMLSAVQLRPALLPTPGHLLLGAVVAGGLSVLAAIRPSLAATRVAPLVALRDADSQSAGQALPRGRRVAGVVLVAAAGLTAATGITAGGSMAGVWLLLLSAISAVGGLFGALGPVVVPAIGRLFGAVAGRVGGTQWRLAGVELRRMPHRAAAVAMPLVLASALITFGVTTMDALGASARLDGSRPQADAVVTDSGERPLSDAAVRTVVDQPEVGAAAVLHAVTGGPVGTGRSAWAPVVAGTDPAGLRELLAALGTDAEPGPASGAAPLGAQEALLSEWALNRLDGQVGARVVLPGLPGGDRTVTVAGVLPDGVFGDADVLLADPGLAPASSVLVSWRAGANGADYAARVRLGLADAPTVLVDTVAERGAEIERQLDVLTAVMMVLLGLSVAVAVTGIGTALAISVRERRKELALRRALGVTRAGLLGGVLAEAVLLALVGVVGGGALGFGYAAALTGSAGLFAMSPGVLTPLLCGGLVVVVLAVLTALGPARAAGRIRPAAGLASG